MKITSAGLMLLLVISVSAFAESFTEKNQKIAYLKETGFGPEEKYAAVKLDTRDTLQAGCLWDIIIFDPSNAGGEKVLSDLNGVLQNNTAVKLITFKKDPETADCILEKYEL